MRGGALERRAEAQRGEAKREEKGRRGTRRQESIGQKRVEDKRAKEKRREGEGRGRIDDTRRQEKECDKHTHTTSQIHLPDHEVHRYPPPKLRQQRSSCHHQNYFPNLRQGRYPPRSHSTRTWRQRNLQSRSVAASSRQRQRSS